MLDWKFRDSLTEAASVLGGHVDGNIENLTFLLTGGLVINDGRRRWENVLALRSF